MPASHQDELIISVARNHRQVFRTNQEAHVGREGNVRIGADDVNLHRVMFVVWHNGSTWMIGNKSSYLPLTITPNLQHSHAVTTMGPKSVTSLPPGESRITFSTQTRSYTVMVLIPVHVMNRPSKMRAVSGDLTVLPQRFNEEQEQLLKILAKFQHETKDVPRSRRSPRLWGGRIRRPIRRSNGSPRALPRRVSGCLNRIGSVWRSTRSAPVGITGDAKN